MRTRCPACSTTFRVTSEQLRLKAGKVRCGQCLAIFNAFEFLIDEDPPAPVVEAHTIATPPPAPAEQPPSITLVESLAPSAPPAAEPEPPPPPAPPTVRKIAEETVAESTFAARQAGLVAARELMETQAYNRWATGTLTGDSSTQMEMESPRQATWPFMLATLLLGSLLAAQLLFHFRTAVVQRLPETAQLYALLRVDVPLPRNAEQIGIDASDLQSDNARGLLVLQATLRNRAPFAQAWPALELTLTDTNDNVISRRVLQAAEYLPPATDTSAFPARSDMAVRLWLEAKGITAAGYRLYLFYP